MKFSDRAYLYIMRVARVDISLGVAKGVSDAEGRLSVKKGLRPAKRNEAHV